MRWLLVKIAICFGLGKLPAPGTFGSLPGLVLGALCATFLSPLATTIVLLFLGLLTYISISVTEKVWHTHDDSRIVIDEVLGCAMAVAYVPAQPIYWVLGFALFRLFDIWKPGPIGYIDKNLPGSFATLLDDVAAGIVTAACLAVAFAVGL